MYKNIVVLGRFWFFLHLWWWWRMKMVTSNSRWRHSEKVFSKVCHLTVIKWFNSRFSNSIHVLNQANSDFIRFIGFPDIYPETTCAIENVLKIFFNHTEWFRMEPKKISKISNVWKFFPNSQRQNFECINIKIMKYLNL